MPNIFRFLHLIFSNLVSKEQMTDIVFLYFAIRKNIHVYKKNIIYRMEIYCFKGSFSSFQCISLNILNVFLYSFKIYTLTRLWHFILQT